MQLRALFATAALAATMGLAAPALADPIITVIVGEQPLPAGQMMIADFDTPVANGFTFVQNTNAGVRDGALGNPFGDSAPPPGTPSMYESVQGGGLATLTALTPLRLFSFYLGSPDSYNTVTFTGLNNYSLTLSGHDIWGAANGDNGDQSWGRRVSYDFGSQGITKIEFASGSNAFEFDSLAGASGAVPEPATWAFMILGFGGAGAMLRRRRAAATFA